MKQHIMYARVFLVVFQDVSLKKHDIYCYMIHIFLHSVGIII